MENKELERIYKNFNNTYSKLLKELKSKYQEMVADPYIDFLTLNIYKLVNCHRHKYLDIKLGQNEAMITEINKIVIVSNFINDNIERIYDKGIMQKIRDIIIDGICINFYEFNPVGYYSLFGDDYNLSVDFLLMYYELLQLLINMYTIIYSLPRNDRTVNKYIQLRHKQFINMLNKTTLMSKTESKLCIGSA